MREARWWGRLDARAGCGQCLQCSVSDCRRGQSAVQRTLGSGALSQEADHGLASENLGSVHFEIVRVVLLVWEIGSRTGVCAEPNLIDGEE